MMGAYRIGRVLGPWTNFTPPIRGGIFRKLQDQGQDDEDEGSAVSEDERSSLGSKLASLNSSTTSLDLATDAGDDADDISLSGSPKLTARAAAGKTISGITTRRAFSSRLEPEPIAPKKVVKPSTVQVQNAHQRDLLISEAMQKEIDQCIRDYPSLDANTQLEITKKYQALHQRVKDEGFYDCRYSEYGKELIRYSIIFAAFFSLLRAEWYLTSACFLGLFWVCSHPSVTRWHP